MKLAIFGASGRTGQHLVQQALGAGHTVAALVRDHGRLPIHHRDLTIITGDVREFATVERAVLDSEAVISVLGTRAVASDQLLTAGMTNIIAAMNKHGVKRLIVQVGPGLADGRDLSTAPQLSERSLLSLFAPRPLHDCENQLHLIRASRLDWTVVRAPLLDDGPRRGALRTGFLPPDLNPVSRADMAAFLLSQVTDCSYYSASPMVSY